MMPCRVVRVDFLDADAIPCLRRMISASAKFPLASTKAFLHSIMPAPVRSRSSFTSFALISIFSRVFDLLVWLQGFGGNPIRCLLSCCLFLPPLPRQAPCEAGTCSADLH